MREEWKREEMDRYKRKRRKQHKSRRGREGADGYDLEWQNRNRKDMTTGKVWRKGGLQSS